MSVPSYLTVLLLESLSTVASRERAYAMLGEALVGAGLDAVPSDPSAFLVFIEGSLRDVARERLGGCAADAFVSTTTRLMGARGIVVDLDAVLDGPPVAEPSDPG